MEITIEDIPQVISVLGELIDDTTLCIFLFQLMSDSEGGEPSSLVSNQSLDSWENVDETEAKVVPWVPDHIVTHCAGCDAQFWAARWKHHCR